MEEEQIREAAKRLGKAWRIEWKEGIIYVDHKHCKCCWGFTIHRFTGIKQSGIQMFHSRTSRQNMEGSHGSELCSEWSGEKPEKGCFQSWEQNPVFECSGHQDGYISDGSLLCGKRWGDLHFTCFLTGWKAGIREPSGLRCQGSLWLETAVPERTRVSGAMFLDEFSTTDTKNFSGFHNRWFRFETYRKIVCADNFWVI